MDMELGSIVKCRNRNWVLLPSESDIYLLRPLTGGSDEVIKIKKGLSNIIGYDLPTERVVPSFFPPPSKEDVQDFASAHILWNAVRLNLRESAAPFRSLGRISIRPRVYQFVPLLMALKLDPVRLFIADDVGVGKTIEALLVARELYDRGEIKRFAVLCPPYLCEQWEKELKEKFNFEPVMIRSGTISSIERSLPQGTNIYTHFPVQVISIDWVKSDRNKHLFIQFCPDLVIVDEVHGAADSYGGKSSQQERHKLLKEISKSKKQLHLIFLTATPHSGKEEAFRSLLGLLKPEFADWHFSELNEYQRAELAKHFVQRTRKDIEKDWESESCFPERITNDETYELSDEYRELFKKTYEFCFEIIKSSGNLEERKRRVRYWGALALLRCVMSSPSAAALAIRNRITEQSGSEDDGDFSTFVFEQTDQRTDDENPIPPIEATDQTLPYTEKRKLRELAQLADSLKNNINKDNKLLACVKIVKELLRDGFNPIVWCRYVATAEYVGSNLKALLSDVQVITITGRMGDEERKFEIEGIDPEKPRVLVATDCLSEGINLQDKFDAVIHYDLPWNPNRLEQREGRVDRYGQNKRQVKAIRFYGRDNPVDGKVLEILLDKAKEIYKTLGTYVPIPEENESIMEALLNALFFKADAGSQLRLFDYKAFINEFHLKWDKVLMREKVNRTRFAQRALKPAEVKAELEKTDTVLGDPDAVRKFLFDCAQRIGFQIIKDKKRNNVYRIPLDSNSTSMLPDMIKYALPTKHKKDYWLISFDSPTPEGAEYIGRNHPFVAALAQFIFENALKNTSLPDSTKYVSRCGVICTKDVSSKTILLLLRVRYKFMQPTNLHISEEILVAGFSLNNNEIVSLKREDALNLITSAKPDANIPLEEKKNILEEILQNFRGWDDKKIFTTRNDKFASETRQLLYNRAKELEDSHKRIRKAAALQIKDFSIEPLFPPDLIGLLVLQPVEKK